MFRTLALLCIAAPAMAQDVRIWESPHNPPSKLQIHAPTVDYAIATVTFDNTEVHGAHDAFELTWQDITVHIHIIEYIGG